MKGDCSIAVEYHVDYNAIRKEPVSAVKEPKVVYLSILSSERTLKRKGVDSTPLFQSSRARQQSVSTPVYCASPLSGRFVVFENSLEVLFRRSPNRLYVKVLDEYVKHVGSYEGW
jgi:hypothetical protein